jgi:hypothetical protein
MNNERVNYTILNIDTRKVTITVSLKFKNPEKISASNVSIFNIIV